LREDKPVQAKLKPEPDNDYDQHAIAVFINYPCAGPYKAGGQREQLPPPGKLFFF